MWEKIKSLFVIMHRTSRNENQKKKTVNIMLVGEVLTELFMIYVAVVEFPKSGNFLKILMIFYVLFYLIGIIVTLCTKKTLVPSLMFNLAFLYGFTLTFLSGRNDIFGSLWMIIIPCLSMFILNFAVSFWCCLTYGIIVIFLTFYGPTREILLNNYSEVFLNRYWAVYLIDLILSTITMLQVHVMRYNQNRNNERLEQAVKMEREKVASISTQTILSINNAVQAKDLYTGLHCQRVAHFSCLIAEKLGWSEEQIKDLRFTALLHDIGKIGVAEDILNKPGRLTDNEYAQMKSHTTVGGEILKGLSIIPHVDSGATSHHERYDGKGYPHGLLGEKIPIEARIIGIADSFDAMNFSRIYRPKCSLDYVKEELKKGRGTQFDPEITDVFIEICEENNWFQDFVLV